MLVNGDEEVIEPSSKGLPLANAFECLLENASDAIYILDMRGNFVAVNRKAEELTGFKREDFIGKPFKKIIPLKSFLKALKGFQDVIKGKSIRLELELKTAFKKTIPVELTSAPLVINGKIVGTHGIFREITEQKQMEKGLKETNKKLEMLLKTAMEGITIIDSEENFTFVNKAFADMLGFREDELLGMNLRRLVDEESFKKVRHQTAVRRKGKTSRYELVLYRKDGEPRIFQVSASPLWNDDGSFAGSLGICMDVTERRKIEEKLIEWEDRLRQLIEYAPDAIYSNDLNGNLIDVNKQAEELTGFKKEELIGKNMLEVGLLPEKYLPKAIEALEKNKRGQRSGPDEFELRRKDGNTVRVEISTFPVKSGGKVEVLGIARDITERTEMEEKLRESEERLRNLYESVPDALAVYVGREGHLLDYNTVFKKRAGYTDEELKEKTFLDFVHPDDHALVLEKYRTKYSEEELPLIYEVRFVNKKRETIPIEISVGTYKKKGRVIGIEVIHRDITERKSMEKKLQEYAEHLEEMVQERTKELKEAHERLVKSERLAAIGQVASMISHDLRNPLTGIAGATYYLKTKLGPKMDEKTREMLEIIEKDIEHSNKIINDLLEYSREIKLELTEAEPKSIMKEALSLVEIPKNLQLLDATESQPKIRVDVEKLKRVFVNIIRNAIEAMPEGGKLTITSNEKDDNLKIAFSDTGVGMSKDTLERLWTPFFTTKAKGMGLGLAICKNITEAHGGSVSVESRVGVGTTVTVTLPIEPELKGGEKVWVTPQESL